VSVVRRTRVIYYSNHAFGSECIRIVSSSSLSCSLDRRPGSAGSPGGDATRPQSCFPRCPLASMQVKERLPAGRRPNPHTLYCTQLLPLGSDHETNNSDRPGLGQTSLKLQGPHVFNEFDSHPTLAPLSSTTETREISRIAVISTTDQISGRWYLPALVRLGAVTVLFVASWQASS
jgi:hypothetical protein